MKLIHLSDLHLGKRVNEFSMAEDQEYILKKIINIIDSEKPDGVIIAGDVYDKPIPPTEAIELFDSFLFRLSQMNLQVFIISGNHDSPERLSFANRLIDQSGIHISRDYNGEVTPFTLNDEYGEVRIYMLPFIKPVHVRQFFPDEAVESYTDAVRTAVNKMEVSDSVRNVIVTHQFVTGAARSESEEISVGGSDNVDASVFNGFDYVALGHIHNPQNIGAERIRYCGTPLKYSFSEASHQKSVTVVELKEKGSLSVKSIELVPLRDMVELKGTYDELTLKSFYEGTSYQTDYVHITLTDEDDIPGAVSRLRVIYQNLMKLDYDNKRTRHNARISGAGDVENKTPLDLFAEFYVKQNGYEMTGEQLGFMKEMIEKIWEGEK
ncbi:MAG: exonuclease SbcCD subunit D [Clostridiales bacterium]|nr:exonuclease SbcCD subunit D [Clostridiales bacterium]